MPLSDAATLSHSSSSLLWLLLLSVLETATLSTVGAEEATLQLFQWAHEHPFCWY